MAEIYRRTPITALQQVLFKVLFSSYTVSARAPLLSLHAPLCTLDVSNGWASCSASTPPAMVALVALMTAGDAVKLTCAPAPGAAALGAAVAGPGARSTLKGTQELRVARAAAWLEGDRPCPICRVQVDG